jgi:hypothetical protein
MVVAATDSRWPRNVLPPVSGIGAGSGGHPWRLKGITAVIAEVNRARDVLVKLAPLEAKLSDRTQNRTHAQQLDSALAEVETLLASAPGVLAAFLFNPLPPLTMTKDGELTMAMPPLIEDIERAYRKRADSLPPN